MQGKDKLVNMEAALTTKIENIKAREQALADEKKKAQDDLDAIRKRYPNPDTIPKIQKDKLAEYDAKVTEADRKAKEAADLRAVYNKKLDTQRAQQEADADKKRKKKKAL